MVAEQLNAKLGEPFLPTEIKWKAQVVRGNRALAVPYVDARLIEDRLDAVFGVDGWQDAYQVLPNNNVICRLRVKIGQEWIEKCDVGGQSDQPDEGDRVKSAFSDALKRAAVKLGIGRYLYRLPQQWVDYDPQTRQIARPPRAPDRIKSAPTDKISRAQWEELRGNLARNGISQRRFLQHFQIDKPGDLPVERWQEALALSLQPRPEEANGAA